MPCWKMNKKKNKRIKFKPFLVGLFGNPLPAVVLMPHPHPHLL